MDPSLFGFLEMAVGLVGVGFGIGGLARLRQGKPERGPGDRASCWGLMVFGLLISCFGFVQWAGEFWI